MSILYKDNYTLQKTKSYNKNCWSLIYNMNYDLKSRLHKSQIYKKTKNKKTKNKNENKTKHENQRTHTHAHEHTRIQAHIHTHTHRNFYNLSFKESSFLLFWNETFCSQSEHIINVDLDLV